MSADRLDNLVRPKRNQLQDSERYSKFVRLARLILPVIAVIVMSIVFLWGSLTNETVIPLEEGDLTVESVGKNELINPRFESRDDKKQPYIITAARALQSEDDEDLIVLEMPSGEITLESADIVALSAQNGAFRQDDSRLLLKGAVKLAHSNGATLDTEELNVDLKKNQAWTDAAVFTRNQDGRIEAAGLRADQEQETLKFLGPAKMTIINSDIESPLENSNENEEQP